MGAGAVTRQIEGVAYHLGLEWWPCGVASSRYNPVQHLSRPSPFTFRDPLALTVYDDEHSQEEERWATLGKAENGQYLVVIHTWQQPSSIEIGVRLISARKARKEEIQNYQKRPH